MTITQHTHPPATPARRVRRLTAPALSAFALTAALALTGCGSPASPGAEQHTSHAAHAEQGTEAEAAQARLVLTHDGGMSVLNAATGKIAAELPLSGFNRVSPAGDGRHVLVSTAGGFQVLDMGSWSEKHGDHFHHFTGTPALAELKFPATKPGHVVNHDGSTALFDDGTGNVQIFNPTELGQGALPATQNYTASAAHHGVAVQLAGGELVVTEGTSESRSGIKLLAKPGSNGTRAVLAESKDCPGVHGEASAQGGAVVVGCQDGILVVKDGKIVKIASPERYGRIGNQAGSEASPVVLGDYKKDKDAELERPATFSLTNTATGKLTLVPINYSYSFRSLARGADGAALILGTDGKLHIHDANSGKESGTVAVVAPWEEPLDWQQPRPAIFVDGTTAYVSEPAKKLLHVVDLGSSTVTASHPLAHTPNEITGISG
ncbi:zinc metallochaperone AztD [Arthrobacter sp. HLT1-20]